MKSALTFIFSFLLIFSLKANPNLLFIGAGLNGSPGGELYEINLTSNMSTSIATLGIGGMTADSQNGRIYFTAWEGTSTTGYANLYMFTVGGGGPTQIGVIKNSGSDFRIDGLAMVGGVLYGSRAAGLQDGLYRIDMATFEVTQIDPLAGRSVSGIDADPKTGLIYGADDNSGMIISIDPAGPTISNVAAYPAGRSDFDGVGVDDQGNIYIMEDQPQPIQIYNLGTNSYTTLATPITGTLTFSAGAAVFCTNVVPTVGEWGLIILLITLMIFGAVTILNRKGAYALGQ